MIALNINILHSPIRKYICAFCYILIVLKSPYVVDRTLSKRKHIKGSKECLFIRTQTHNLQIFGVIPFVKLHLCSVTKGLPRKFADCV